MWGFYILVSTLNAGMLGYDVYIMSNESVSEKLGAVCNTNEHFGACCAAGMGL